MIMILFQGAKDKITKRFLFNYLYNLYDNYNINIIKVKNFNYSTIILVDLQNKETKNVERVVVKKYKDLNKKSYLLSQYSALEEFYTLNKNPLVTSPKPIKIDLEKNLFLMEYKQGPTLKELLTRFRYTSTNLINDYISFSAVGLHAYHSLMYHRNSRPPSIKEVKFPGSFRFLLPEETENIIDKLLPNVYLKNKVTLFRDYKPDNIIINGNKICLFDFPTVKTILTPHFDIGFFFYYLGILSQHPQNKYLKLNLRNFEIFKVFLDKYSPGLYYKLNQEDIQLIHIFIKLLARKDLEYFSNSKGVKLKFTKIYLKNFLDDFYWFDKC